MQKKVLSLRLPSEFGAPLKEFTIKESTYSKCQIVRAELTGGSLDFDADRCV